MPKRTRSARKSPVKSSGKPHPGPKKSCPVIGIGASAGGLEAFTELLKYLRPDTGFAFAFVQHLDPAHPSQLTAILSRATKMPVCEATDGIKVEADHVYIIPPQMDMSIADEVLHLLPRTDKKGLHLPIDSFFRSLAAECRTMAIGIVLSGNASDGTLGLKAIKEAGGITFAQSEGSARYAGMPRSAASSGCVDFILPPKKIASELVRLSRHPLVSAPAEPPRSDALSTIFGLLRRAIGVDFSQYKQTTIRRRIQRRVMVHRFDTIEDYAAHLKDHPEEIDALHQELLIHVTSFFREPETFADLAKIAFPAS